MNYAHAKRKQLEWSARGGLCPICKREFRRDCNHTVTEARNRMEMDVLYSLTETVNKPKK